MLVDGPRRRKHAHVRAMPRGGDGKDLAIQRLETMQTACASPEGGRHAAKKGAISGGAKHRAGTNDAHIYIYMC
eukprot:8092346-Pyramimonas_sp.AAC.1